MVAKNMLEPFASPPTDLGLMELTLMLPRCQFAALEERAHELGISVAQLLRRLVRESIVEEEEAEPISSVGEGLR